MSTTKKPNDTQPTTTTQSETPMNDAPPTVIAKPDVPATALTVKIDYDAEVTRVRGVMTTTLTAFLDKVTDETTQKGLRKLLQSTQPIKGREELSRAWNIPIIRIAYGTTKDAGKPASCKNGDMFATNGRKIDAPFVFTPMYMYESSRMFQDNSAAPTCWSPDGKLGKMFGECAKCPNLPLGKNKAGALTDCNAGISAVVLGKDMQVYRLEFFKTSRKAGAALDKLTQSGMALWERWFELSAALVNKDNYEYSVFKVAAEGSDVPDQVQTVCNTMYDFIDVERKAFLHHFYAAVSTGNGSAAPLGEHVDEAAMMGGDTNPDLANSGM